MRSRKKHWQRTSRVRFFQPSVELLENRLVPSVVTNLVGSNQSVEGINETQTGFFPPDPVAAAGPTYVMEAVNDSIEFINKATGNISNLQTLQTFFGRPAATGMTDPQVIYDEQASRFVLTVEETPTQNPNTSYVDFAASNTSDPTQGFTSHLIPVLETIAGTSYFADQPRLGWNADAYVVSMNMFILGTTTFGHVQLLSIDKSTVLNANLTDYFVDPPTNVYFHASMVPAAMHGSGAGGPMWLVENNTLNNGTTNSILVTQMTNVLSANPAFQFTPITVNAFTATPRATQPGQGADTIDASDGRIQSVDWRGNRLVAAHSVGISASDTLVHARWYEFNTAVTPMTVRQQGTINPNPGNGINTWNPSVAIAANGDLGMTYLESSSNATFPEYMSMYITGQRNGDSLGHMEEDVPVQLGSTSGPYSNPSNPPGARPRSGDYSTVALDPSATNLFWAVNEYSRGVDGRGNSLYWGTKIAQFDVTQFQIRDIAGNDGSGNWWMGLSTGDAFSNAFWGSWSPSVPNTAQVLVGDFNGDGLSDIAAFDSSTGKWWVLISNGTSFNSPVVWTTWSTSVTWVDLRVGDFNGDGKADIAGRTSNSSPSPGQWWVAKSTGSSFDNGTGAWTTWSTSVTWVDVSVGDFNGDGKSDIAGRTSNSSPSPGQWWVAKSTGSSFDNGTGAWTTWSTSVTWVDVQVGDFNADGLTDIAGRSSNNSPSPGQWWVAKSTGSSFDNGPGAWTTWSTAVTWTDVSTGYFGKVTVGAGAGGNAPQRLSSTGATNFASPQLQGSAPLSLDSTQNLVPSLQSIQANQVTEALVEAHVFLAPASLLFVGDEAWSKEFVSAGAADSSALDASASLWSAFPDLTIDAALIIGDQLDRIRSQ